MHEINRPNVVLIRGITGPSLGYRCLRFYDARAMPIPFLAMKVQPSCGSRANLQHAEIGQSCDRQMVHTAYAIRNRSSRKYPQCDRHS